MITLDNIKPFDMVIPPIAFDTKQYLKEWEKVQKISTICNGYVMSSTDVLNIERIINLNVPIIIRHRISVDWLNSANNLSSYINNLETIKAYGVIPYLIFFDQEHTNFPDSELIAAYVKWTKQLYPTVPIGAYGAVDVRWRWNGWHTRGLYNSNNFDLASMDWYHESAEYSRWCYILSQLKPMLMFYSLIGYYHDEPASQRQFKLNGVRSPESLYNFGWEIGYARAGKPGDEAWPDYQNLKAILTINFQDTQDWIDSLFLIRQGADKADFNESLNRVGWVSKQLSKNNPWRIDNGS